MAPVAPLFLGAAPPKAQLPSNPPAFYNIPPVLHNGYTNTEMKTNVPISALSCISNLSVVTQGMKNPQNNKARVVLRCLSSCALQAVLKILTSSRL